jgi:hypothetical protein
MEVKEHPTRLIWKVSFRAQAGDGSARLRGNNSKPKGSR